AIFNIIDVNSSSREDGQSPLRQPQDRNLRPPACENSRLNGQQPLGAPDVKSWRLDVKYACRSADLSAGGDLNVVTPGTEILQITLVDAAVGDHRVEIVDPAQHMRGAPAELRMVDQQNPAGRVLEERLPHHHRRLAAM